jgi:hypothetical protein
MKMATTPALLILMFLLASAPEAKAQHATMTDGELMAGLKGAAPQNVVEHATIMNMGSDKKKLSGKGATAGPAWTPVEHQCVPTRLQWSGRRLGRRKVQRRRRRDLYTC